MIRLLLVACLIVWPVTVSAQPAWATHLAIGGYVTSASADLAVTTYGLGAGIFREANPILRPFEHDPLGMALVKMGVGSVVSYVLIKRRSSKATFWLSVGLTALNSWMAVRNSRLVQEARHGAH
jgi:hypothetical protein